MKGWNLTPWLFNRVIDEDKTPSVWRVAGISQRLWVPISVPQGTDFPPFHFVLVTDTVIRDIQHPLLLVYADDLHLAYHNKTDLKQ